MKRFFALAALVLGLAACQTEPEGLDVNVGGEQLVTVNVTVPEAETRADVDKSAKGVFDNGVLGTADDNTTMRYILQVYLKNGEQFIQSDERLVEYSDGKTVNFEVRLVPGRDYQFVVWADVVTNGKQDIDNHYVTMDANKKSTLGNITLNGEWNAMDESRDAFTATEFISNFNGSKGIDIKLYRPFAKLRVVTTDIENLTNLGIAPATAKATYTSKHYASFNAVEGKVNGTEDQRSEVVEYTYTIAMDAENKNIYGEGNKAKEFTIFTDYFFANDETVKFTLDVNDSEGTPIKSNSFVTDINVKRNYLTTIKGNILTDGKGFEVKIEDAFSQPEIERPVVEVHDANALQDAINNAEDGKETTITLGGDIDLNDLLGAGILSTRAAATLPIVIPEGKTLVLDLNGFNITTPYVEGSTTNHSYAFENHGSLTIQDSSEGKTGEIIARGNFNYGTMTLESGSIVACDGNGGYGVRNYEGATFVMNGGAISTSLEDGDLPGAGYDATTLRIDEGATATINGGTINNICNFTLAIDNHGTTTIKGGTFTSVHTTIGNRSTMTIDGGSFTCNGLEGITAHALWADAGTTTINGGTFDGKDNYNGFNVDAAAGAVVNINGGKFLPVHSGSLYGEGTINVMGGEFFDDPSERLVAGCGVTEQENGYYVVENNGYYTDANGIYYITDVKGLQWLAEQTNGGNAFQGKTIKLVNDIDLNNVEWTPIGTTTNQFKGNLDGQSYTIKNLYIESADNYQGLFGYATGGTISNLIIENANVKGKSYVAAVTGCGFLTSHSNITVTGDVKIEGSGQDIAVITGYTYANTTTININVNEGSYVKGDSYFGSVVGYPGEGNTKFENIKSNIDVIGKQYMIGGITGIAMYGNKFIDCHYTGNVYLMEGDATSNNRWMRIGGIAGSWMDGNESYVVTLENCSFTGELFSQKTDGTTATKFDFDGYVGRSYNATNVGKLIINGKTYTKVASIGDTSYLSLEEAIAAAQNDDTIVLCSNVTLAETATIAEGKTMTLDLNGKTITGTMHKSVGAVVKNEGTLTVKNGTIKSTADNGGSAILNYGTIVVEDVTLNGAPMVEGGWPSYAVNNYGNLTVNSATINTYHGAIATGGDGVAVINDATVDVGQSTQTKQTSWALYVFENGQLTVNNGTFKNTKDEKNKVYGGGYICATSTKETVINGGTFDKTEGDNNGTGLYYQCKNLEIKGGTFDVDPSKYVADGYSVVDNGNGTYTVLAGATKVN